MCTPNFSLSQFLIHWFGNQIAKLQDGVAWRWVVMRRIYVAPEFKLESQEQITRRQI